VLLPLVLLFILVPIAELAVIIQVGQAIGVWWTIGLLIADSLLGSVLMRAQGRAAWRRFTASVQSGRVPAREVLDGALVLLGGALLLTPGFLSDVLGLLLLLPPTRAVVRRLLVRRFGQRLVVSLSGRRTSSSREPSNGGTADVEGTAVDVEPGTLPPERQGPGA
jgi:UPF0716 protein FxsA